MREKFFSSVGISWLAVLPGGWSCSWSSSWKVMRLEHHPLAQPGGSSFQTRMWPGGSWSSGSLSKATCLSPYLSINFQLTVPSFSFDVKGHNHILSKFTKPKSTCKKKMYVLFAAWFEKDYLKKLKAPACIKDWILTLKDLGLGPPMGKTLAEGVRASESVVLWSFLVGCWGKLHVLGLPIFWRAPILLGSWPLPPPQKPATAHWVLLTLYPHELFHNPPPHVRIFLIAQGSCSLGSCRMVLLFEGQLISP